VRAIKYGHNFFLARHLTGMLLSAMEGCDWQVDLITAVPLSPRHERSRGYNQAALLAQPLADLLKLPYLGKAIRRSRETRSQVNLNLAERQLNVSGAFSANPDLVRGRRVLIVDDVYTTGATLNECARALKDSGAKEVYALALCKALHSLETASIG
jgi:ComF family protein